MDAGGSALVYDTLLFTKRLMRNSVHADAGLLLMWNRTVGMHRPMADVMLLQAVYYLDFIK